MNLDGKVRKRIWNKEGKENWRDVYEWSLTSQKAVKVIEKLYPFLFLKRKQAELAMQVGKLLSSRNAGMKRWNLDLFERIQCEINSLKEECLLLNKRGKNEKN